MLTGEPPFGYGGTDLPQRILSGISQTESTTAHSSAGHALVSQSNSRETELAREDQFLSIVR